MARLFPLLLFGFVVEKMSWRTIAGSDSGAESVFVKIMRSVVFNIHAVCSWPPVSGDIRMDLDLVFRADIGFCIQPPSCSRQRPVSWFHCVPSRKKWALTQVRDTGDTFIPRAITLNHCAWWKTCRIYYLMFSLMGESNGWGFFCMFFFFTLTAVQALFHVLLTYSHSPTGSQRHSTHRVYKWRVGNIKSSLQLSGKLKITLMNTHEQLISGVWEFLKRK